MCQWLIFVNGPFKFYFLYANTSKLSRTTPRIHFFHGFHSLFIETQKLCPENEENPVYNTFIYGIKKKNEKRSIILLIWEHPTSIYILHNQDMEFSEVLTKRTL